MPLLRLRCPGCGHEYDGLKTFSTADPDVDMCPKCGVKPEQLPIAGNLKRERLTSDMDPLELQEALDAKAYYETEEFSRQVLTGEKELNERGPKELRPVCPEHLRRKYF